MIFRRNAAVVAAIIAQACADASNGLDNPPANGEAGDYSDDPVYYVGNQVEIKWHMNFTNALLKLVQTPSDHESTSSYIIASPTNNTSYERTVSYLDLDETYTAFYFSVYRAGASDASFISHYVNILPARSTSSTYSSASSSQGSPTTFSTTEKSSTAITSSRGTTSVSAASTPSSVAPTENSQAMSGASTAGIAIGSTMGTFLLVGLIGWCGWQAYKRRSRTQEMTVMGDVQHSPCPGNGRNNQDIPDHDVYQETFHGINEFPDNQLVELDHSGRQ